MVNLQTDVPIDTSYSSKNQDFFSKKKLEIDGQMNGSTDQWMDGPMDGQT